MMVYEDGTPYDAPLSEHARKRYERTKQDTLLNLKMQYHHLPNLKEYHLQMPVKIRKSLI